MERTKYRVEEISNRYTKSGMFNPEIVAYGSQILYEVEEDLKAMKFAIKYLSEYLKYREESKTTPHTFGDDDANKALVVLVKRVSVYSCPNSLKDEYKTKENCPLKEACKCLQGVSDK